jgi:hypothetical protein
MPAAQRMNTMSVNEQNWILRNKMVLSLAAIGVLAGAWWAFRPEKLFINQKVSEPAPFSTSGEPQPIYTGELQGKAHATSGRATVYRAQDGKLFLRLSDFSTSNGPDVHVLLLKTTAELDKELLFGDPDKVEVGSLKGNQGDQNYNLPPNADLNQYQTVAIYCERFHVVFANSRLEKF